MDRPAIGVAAGVLIGGAAQLLFQVPFLMRHGLHLWRRSARMQPALNRMARLMVPAVLGGAVYQINILVGTLLASTLAEGSVSYLYYADRLVEFPLGVVAMAGAAAALPSMAREAAAGNVRALRDTFAYAFRLVSFVTIPATAGLILLREPIVALLFMRGEFGAVDVRLTAQALSYYAIGLWAFAAVRIAVAAFFALQDSRTPFHAAIVSILANLLLGLVLMNSLAHSGMALATSLASLLNLAILLTFLRRRIEGVDWRGIGASLGRSLLSAGIMAAGVAGIARALLPGLHQNPAALAVGLSAAIGGGALVYFAASRALGSAELGDLLAPLTRRGRSR
jgi:putative peptidoglycan lipid II flippase